MEFDQSNPIVKLCAEGMEREGQGLKADALKLYERAWDASTTDFEKFTAAHYVARHQETISEKLKWDETALQFALNIDDDNVQATFPSLYLNIAKCYEDLNDLALASKNYTLALSFTDRLPDNGYGNMIRNGILNGLDRVK
jgi:rifampin ADP-ribosylating transferase